MLIGWLDHDRDWTGANARGVHFQADTGADGSAAASDTPADEADADADDSATADADDDEGSEEGGEATSEVTKLRRQAARYRTERNSAREQLTTAHARIAELEARVQAAPDPAAAAEERVAAAERRALVAETFAEAGLDARVLRAFRNLDGAADEAAVTAAIEELRPYLASRGSSVQRPPSDPATPATLDEQIADAEKRGDTRASMRLKAQKLAAKQ